MDDQISALLAETHNNLREQLSAAQRHFERLEQLLETRESRDIADLNRAARRLRLSDGDWARALVEASAGFCERAALFILRAGSLHLEASSCGVNVTEDVPLDAAPAFRAAVDTKDPVVAVRTCGEMSAPVSAAFGESVEKKFHLFPISSGGRVGALLYVDGLGVFQHDALELLATVAGLALESRAEKVSDGLVNIAVTFDPTDRDRHLKAQRFARVQVAEIRLYQDEHVKNGRTDRDLYASLKTEIDAARDAYRRVFLEDSAPMTDYLHQELVHTLARGDVQLLGPEYPGPLV